jgi:hypothetical protein
LPGAVSTASTNARISAAVDWPASLERAPMFLARERIWLARVSNSRWRASTVSPERLAADCCSSWMSASRAPATSAGFRRAMRQRDREQSAARYRADHTRHLKQRRSCRRWFRSGSSDCPTRQQRCRARTSPHRGARPPRCRHRARLPARRQGWCLSLPRRQSGFNRSRSRNRSTTMPETGTAGT